MSSLRALLSQIPDHRGCSGRKYSFDSIIMLVVAGFMCGCNSISAVARFAASLNHPAARRLFLDFHREPPPARTHTTFPHECVQYPIP